MNYFSVLESLLPDLKPMDEWRQLYNGQESNSGTGSDFTTDDNFKRVIQSLSERLQQNYPFHHPSYAGQMLKPPHPIAWIAYLLTATINPNNHALDGGPPTSHMEKEVMQELAKMVDYDPEHFLGHLTSGGTMANLEALWVASRIHPGQKIAYSEHAHYTHGRMCKLLRQDALTVPLDEDQLPDMNWLQEHHLEIGTLVVTMGTTGLGVVEPLADLVEFCTEHRIRIHIDAAYGGFFKLIHEQLPTSHHWAQFSKADSIVIDPHKHGLQPYGCGAVLYNDPDVARFYQHDSPYTYFSSDELHLGEISLECSRAGASAAALWATLQYLPLSDQGNGLGSILADCRNAAITLANHIKAHSDFGLLKEPDLDIIGFYPLHHDSISSLSAHSRKIFESGMNAEPGKNLHLSLYKIPSSQLEHQLPDIEMDLKEATILRSVLMKPGHKDFTDEFMARLESFAASD